MQTIAPPPIPANDLRPGRHWYVTAASIAVVLIVLGVLIGVYRFYNVIDAVDIDRQFANGQTVSLRLDPDSEQAIWIRDEEFEPTADPECSITGPGDPRLTEPGIDVFLTRHETWNPLLTIDVARAGDYEITCSSHAQSKYAIGDSGGIFALAGWLILAIALPVLGITVCVVIVLVTAVRRHLHRKRLLAERQGAGS
ncbi:hypothetical protein OG264_22125 [Streptomyces xanthophaeus]|uniref:hypothetical protein n=1 Tax=Streptomyces xanthophaeus TaxID=67385 RepID=UPI00386B3BCC|nr:hypothetical protein OG264_22125 [Streptomyces xanthophaeus]WST61074.1 hypothetical protein OG605_16320 [Streptomyces xanthophaeus]